MNPAWGAVDFLQLSSQEVRIVLEPYRMLPAARLAAAAAAFSAASGTFCSAAASAAGGGGAAADSLCFAAEADDSQLPVSTLDVVWSGGSVAQVQPAPSIPVPSSAALAEQQRWGWAG